MITPSKVIRVGSRWHDGSRIWRVEDITMQGETSYYCMNLLRGSHPFALNRVVEANWFISRRKAV